MIKTNELRVGNVIVSEAGVVRTVTGHDIREQWWHEDDPHGSVGASINPIPLTPEWLERCGIIEKESSLPGELRFAGEGNFTIEAIEEGKPKYYLPFNKRIEVKYLHQLQNIYLDLTGEELNVNL